MTFHKVSKVVSWRIAQLLASLADAPILEEEGGDERREEVIGQVSEIIDRISDKPNVTGETTKKSNERTSVILTNLINPQCYKAAGLDNGVRHIELSVTAHDSENAHCDGFLIQSGERLSPRYRLFRPPLGGRPHHPNALVPVSRVTQFTDKSIEAHG
ncbi:hypothetical protein SAMN05444166_4558 [Singulisphaera sp. GP187]|nr:hypothetical protein SAMN05444166_4558 [Singulisphaera sp. GP187]